MGRLRKEWTAKEFSIRKRGGRNLDRKGGFPRTPTHPSCSLEYTGPAGVHHDRERARHARNICPRPPPPPACPLKSPGPAGPHPGGDRARHARVFPSPPRRRRSTEGELEKS